MSGKENLFVSIAASEMVGGQLSNADIATLLPGWIYPKRCCILGTEQLFSNITHRHSHLTSGTITAHSFGKHSASTYYTLGTVAAEECLTVPAHKII